MPSRMTRYPVAAAAILALLGTMPPAAEARADDRDAIKAAKNADARILVRNSNSLDIEVHVIAQSGRRFRLGKVRRMSNRAFLLPEWFADGRAEIVVKVYAFAPPAAGSAMRRYLQGVETKPFPANVGENLRLEVTDPLTESFIH